MSKKAQAKPVPQSDGLFAELDVDPVPELKFTKGHSREFLVTAPSPIATQAKKMSSKEFLALGALLLITAFVRCKDLASPNSVVFDEVHFGGFSRKYVLGSYFMDVHPPLAKMLLAAVSSMAGYDGEFLFKNIGDTFEGNTPYYYMRLFPAVLGVFTVLLCYLTLRHSGCRPLVCLATASLLAIENANVTISRYILLDSPLMFFIAASIYALKKFETQSPFSIGWFKSLFACGLALGLAVSSKWVGLFTIAWVGISCVFQLWFVIGDLTVSAKKVFWHIALRGSILLGVPAVLYYAFFVVHFQVLTNDGDGSAFMSSAFRSTLNGNTIPRDIPAPVGLGSIVSIRHLNTQGGYLHSHAHFYPTGSKQQQITLYPHLDSNNDWIIEPYNDTIPDHFVSLTDGMKIRLKHANTGRRLHSHDEKAPVSERDWQKEASCYGYEGFGGDANDDFTVEIVSHKSAPGKAQEEVRAIETVFRLRHAMTGHYLFSSEMKLPDWGFEQQEVTTASQGARPLTHWYIETNINPRLVDPEIINYPVLSYWDKFVESHKVMWKINQGLTEVHAWQSNPTSWPLLLRGINYWVKDNKQVYLLGNAVTWWVSTLALVVFGVHAVVSLFRWQVGAKIATNKNVFNYNSQVFLYSIGWFLHYFPFFIMGRQLFLHHYLPAYYFAILALGHFLDIFVNYIIAFNKTTRKIGYLVVAIFVSISVLFYVHYSSLIYGSPWTRAACESSKALSSWDYECYRFHDSLAEYSSAAENSVASSNVAKPMDNPEAKEAKETVHIINSKAQSEAHESETSKKEDPVQVEQEEAVAPPQAVDIDETKKEEDAQAAPQVAEADQIVESEPVQNN
ncbi:Dolichyl-phosphate-mannose--protein mannosyltransferase 1 [Meyerozyma sp. JA9]|nr:Dolichyl-phosphate-mannose--protein mannosyltransferase 1 [Meyerozyma sp. JA9]